VQFFNQVLLNLSLIYGYSIFSPNLCSEICLVFLKLQWQCSCCDLSFGSGGGDGGGGCWRGSFGEEMCKGAVLSIEV
jgi:hypothetical protein